MLPSEQTDKFHGIERLGVYLSNMRKRPGMYFGTAPYLMPLHNFLLGYNIAELCHGVTKRHFPTDGFYKWLITEKKLKESSLGWPGIINELESNENAQLHLAIDLLAEYGAIPLLLESDVQTQQNESDPHD